MRMNFWPKEDAESDMPFREIHVRIFFRNLKVMHFQKWLHKSYNDSYNNIASGTSGYWCIWNDIIWGRGCSYLIQPLLYHPPVSSRPANTFTLLPLNLTVMMLHLECFIYKKRTRWVMAKLARFWSHGRWWWIPAKSFWSHGSSLMLASGEKFTCFFTYLLR